MQSERTNLTGVCDGWREFSMVTRAWWRDGWLLIVPSYMFHRHTCSKYYVVRCSSTRAAGGLGNFKLANCHPSLGSMLRARGLCTKYTGCPRTRQLPSQAVLTHEVYPHNPCNKPTKQSTPPNQTSNINQAFFASFHSSTRSPKYISTRVSTTNQQQRKYNIPLSSERNVQDYSTSKRRHGDRPPGRRCGRRESRLCRCQRHAGLIDRGCWQVSSATERKTSTIAHEM
jgi:hypothetical protein